jgi:hypothetical protein
MKRTIFSVSFVWASVIAIFRNVMVQVPFSHLQPGLDSVPDIVKICIERCITVLEGGQWDAAEVSKFATVGTIISSAFEYLMIAFQVPKLSTARFEGVIVGVEQMDGMATAIDTVEEALGVLNVRFSNTYEPEVDLWFPVLIF